MSSEAYEKNRKNAEKYLAKCERVLLRMNPDNADDKRIIDYLAEHNQGEGRATQVKRLLVNYIKMQEALRGIQ